jgi:hypothetical protein
VTTEAFVQSAASYPYLSHLLNAYFHQDALDDGATDDDIVREFAASSHPHDTLGVRADILRFLHQHAQDEDFIGSLNRTFKLDLAIGATDAEAKAWLSRVQRLLEELGAQ